MSSIVHLSFLPVTMNSENMLRDGPIKIRFGNVQNDKQ